MSLYLLLAVLLCLSNSAFCSEYKHTILVDPLSPNRTSNSSCYDSPHHPCADINIALAFAGKLDSTIFELNSLATHYLAPNTSSTLFEGGFRIGFVGTNNTTAVIQCQHSAGLAFINTSYIELKWVSFRQCGTVRNSTSKDFATNKLLEINVGLYFYNCYAVTLQNMSVRDGFEALGVVMYSTLGENYIGYSEFVNNSVDETSQDSGGGGFAVEFNYCVPGDSDCSMYNHQTEPVLNDALYIFEHCKFLNNRALDQTGKNKTGVSILPINDTHSSIGRGGGLSVYFKGESQNNTVMIIDSLFMDNHANWGGGLCVQFADHSIQNNVTAQGTKFMHNHCYYVKHRSGSTGGGVLVSSPVHYYIEKPDYLSGNAIHFNDCHFFSNRALTGGALAFVYTLQRLSSKYQLFSASVVNSNFSFNQARLGSAVAIDHEYYYHQGELGQMSFTNCFFESNELRYRTEEGTYSVGAGALYIAEVHVTFSGTNTFISNSGSALALISTRILFSENSIARFFNNTGSNGGAMAFLGGSSMVVSEHTQMHFENNSASQYGGAIYKDYVGKQDFRSSVKCFILYGYPFSDAIHWDIHFRFKGNKALKLGNSIYSSTILPCSLSNELQAGPELTKSIFCWNDTTWVYEDSNCTQEIYTSPKTFVGVENSSATVIHPGESFQLEINASDDLGHIVTSDIIYYTHIDDNEDVMVDPQYAYVANGSLAILGKENQTFTLFLDVVGNRDWRISLPLYLEECPIGFQLSNPAYKINDQSSRFTRAKCECIGGNETNPFGGHFLCDQSSMTAKISNGYWIGTIPNVSNDRYVVGSTQLLLRNDIPQDFVDLNESQCEYLNRKGPLCGECMEGYATAVNYYNYECVICDNSTNIALNLFSYIALTYIPYLVIFSLIIFFEIKIMAGPLVCFILYAQLVASGVIDLTIGRLPSFGKDTRTPINLLRAYRIAYGVFNLNSFSAVRRPFCINKSFTALDAISLDFAIAAFPLFIIIVIRLLMLIPVRSRKKKTSKLIIEASTTTSTTEAQEILKKTKKSRSMIHPIVAFVYLSYTKFSVAAASILSTTALYMKDGSQLDTRVVYYAGQFYFGQYEYMLPYGLIAIMVFMFVTALLPLLLLGPFDLFNWLTDMDKFRFLNKYVPTVQINTFMQAIRGCYRPKHRYFAGVYFVFRLVMLTIFAFSSGVTVLVLWQLIFVIIMIILVATLMPYEEPFHNYIDIALFFNMALILICSLYLYTLPTSSWQSINTFYIMGYILIWLPFIYLLVYLGWLFFKRMPCSKSPAQSFQQQFGIGRAQTERRPLISSGRRHNKVNTADKFGDSIILRRAEDRNYVPKKGKAKRTKVEVEATGLIGEAAVNVII